MGGERGGVATMDTLVLNTNTLQKDEKGIMKRTTSVQRTKKMAVSFIRRFFMTYLGSEQVTTTRTQPDIASLPFTRSTHSVLEMGRVLTADVETRGEGVVWEEPGAWLTC